MKVAAAHALAGCVKRPARDHIMPPGSRQERGEGGGRCSKPALPVNPGWHGTSDNSVISLFHAAIIFMRLLGCNVCLHNHDPQE